ncbi:MAG: UDP-N-acetylmuramate--L-alanine ligase [Chthonomonadales bacterium]|nr:UDP-N-acetylmuramate--L-alanine ligase [Chthonomonadales bacterium]
MATPKHIHFLGIAGIGVSALAQVAQARGIRVSGSDPNADPAANPAIARLAEGGATLYRTHKASNLAADVDLVVASAAVAEDNPEVRAAQARGVRVISRADFLGELMDAHRGPKIAVAGTHGKTTTTGMLGVLLQNAGLDPTVFVGGEVAELGGNVRVGSEDGPFVAEACEAYDSFMSLKPDIAVLTNVEADHLDHYGTAERVQASFVRFLQNLRPGGTIVACADDPGAKEVLGQFLPTASLTYGITDDDAQMHAHSLQLDTHTAFTWGDPVVSYYDTRIVLNVPGKHNVLNALAAASVAMLLHVPVTEIAEGLRAFHGATRRQEILGEATLEDGSVLVMDDYAHHPTEIRATLDALRSAYPQRRLVAIFQPHLYSRTRDFMEKFAEALALADAVFVTDIYAARETPIAGVRAADIVALAVKINSEAPMIYVPDKADLPNMLDALVRSGDLTLFLGAGDIRTQGERFLKLLQERSAVR